MAPPPEIAAPSAKARRRLRNYLLDTPLQLRLASYLVLVATVLSILLGGLLWRAYDETSRVVALAAPEMSENIAQLLAQEDRIRILWLGGALVVVLLCLLGAAVVVTHRIAGPAYVIRRTCREVGEGRFVRPRPLRSRDLLVDLAEDVATMIDALRARESEERDALRAAAARLADPAATPAQRAEAAADIERIAAEKDARLGAEEPPVAAAGEVEKGRQTAL